MVWPLFIAAGIAVLAEILPSDRKRLNGKASRNVGSHNSFCKGLCKHKERATCKVNIYGDPIRTLYLMMSLQHHSNGCQYRIFHHHRRTKEKVVGLFERLGKKTASAERGDERFEYRQHGWDYD